MMTLDEALQCADTFRQKESVPRILAAEVLRLREENERLAGCVNKLKVERAWAIREVKRLTEENERLRENAKIISELEQLATRSNNDLLVENERLKSLSSIPPDCRTCANRGRVNGLSQESYCESCIWQGMIFRQNHFVDASKMVDIAKRRCEACAILPCSCK